MLTEAFISVLRSGRAEFNHRFAEARRLHPGLDATVFSEFLQTTLDPLVRATEKVAPDRVAELVVAAYDVGLELAGQKLVGAGARHGFIEEGWRRALVAVASMVATSPARMLAAVSNALHQLASTPGARPAQWIDELEKLGPQCAGSEAFLRLGQVLAWRAGLAHFRKGAVAAADALPEPLVLVAVGAHPSQSWPGIRERLSKDPWFDPAAATANGDGPQSRFRVTAQAGAFRGFGGLFVEPPLVAATGDDFLVLSGDDCWLLTADCFGATFHRLTSAEFDAARQKNTLPPGLRITDSRVVWGADKFEIPALGKFTSAAANARTLALTSNLTHAVVLVALGTAS